MARPRPSRASSVSSFINSAAHFSLSSTAAASSSPTSPTSSSFSPSRAGPHGLPLAPVPSEQSRPPAGKRSLRNLLSFASSSNIKKQSKSAAASAAKTTRSRHEDDLDFGCSGLQDDEAEHLILADEVDMMLELQGYQSGTNGTKFDLQSPRQAKTSPQARSRRDRSDSRTALDIPGNRFAGLNIQYTRPTVDAAMRTTKQLQYPPQAELDLSQSSSSASSSSTCFSVPSSPRSSASYSSCSSGTSFMHIRSGACNDSDDDDHTTTLLDSLNNTPVTSTFSHSACGSDAVLSSPSATSSSNHAAPLGAVLEWHPDETEEEAAARRAQEERAAIEALEAYFEIQASSAIVDGRRGSSPTHFFKDPAMMVEVQPRRGSAPNIPLRNKRSEGSLRPTAGITAGKFRENVSSARRPHFGGMAGRYRSHTTASTTSSLTVNTSGIGSSGATSILAGSSSTTLLPSIPSSPASSMTSFLDMEDLSPSLPHFPKPPTSTTSSRRGSVAAPTYEYI